MDWILCLYHDLFIYTCFLPVTTSYHGEGNGTPLQYSCLENPMDRGAWKAAVHGVAEDQTRLWATSLSLFTQCTSCIGEGNGNPLQCSCLENPRDGGAWWAAVYGVAQSRTQLMQLSSSSRRWVIEDLALIYVIECSAYIFIYKFYSFWSYI